LEHKQLATKDLDMSYQFSNVVKAGLTDWAADNGIPAEQAASFAAWLFRQCRDDIANRGQAEVTKVTKAGKVSTKEAVSKQDWRLTGRGDTLQLVDSTRRGTFIGKCAFLTKALVCHDQTLRSLDPSMALRWSVERDSDVHFALERACNQFKSETTPAPVRVEPLDGGTLAAGPVQQA